MLKKLFLFLLLISLVVAWLGGIFSVAFSPFSLTIRKPEKDFFIRAVRKVESLVYHEATVHNPSGDMVPDQIDDKIKQEVKDRIN